MRQADRKLIRKLPLFRDMSEANFDKLLGAASLQHLPQHMTLITEGDLPAFLHIVIDGSVQMFSMHDGREATIDVMRPVTMFILPAVIRDTVYLQSARTLVPTEVVIVPAKAVRTMFGRDAAFARAIVNELAESYRTVVRSLKNEKLRTGVERLANWILQINAQQGHHQRVDLTFDKRTLAMQLGMTPTYLSRNLSFLSRHGVKRAGRSIKIEDSAALAQFAKPNALIDD